MANGMLPSMSTAGISQTWHLVMAIFWLEDQGYQAPAEYIINITWASQELLDCPDKISPRNPRSFPPPNVGWPETGLGLELQSGQQLLNYFG